MKIEKVSDNQIRCTLTQSDLADRELKLSELAYGTEKAKSLFRDMMQQAAYEYGFEAEDIPLMIEAIPLSADCIVLIITKVEDPDELDTRFSKFAPQSSADSDFGPFDAPVQRLEGADEVLDWYKKYRSEKQAERQEASSRQGSRTSRKNTEEAANTADFKKFYAFHAIDPIITVSHLLSGSYEGRNSLYKNPSAEKFFLVIHRSSQSAEEFNRVCNVLSEYGDSEKTSGYSESFMKEHYKIIIRNNALQTLADL